MSQHVKKWTFFSSSFIGIASIAKFSEVTETCQLLSSSPAASKVILNLTYKNILQLSPYYQHWKIQGVFVTFQLLDLILNVTTEGKWEKGQGKECFQLCISLYEKFTTKLSVWIFNDHFAGNDNEKSKFVALLKVR
jgi:hypothetical protein